MKKIWFIVLFISASFSIFAQGSYEAFRFSQIDYTGTARYLGAGGAFGATGGEFSALSYNPAAVGLYKRHEFSFTPMTLSFYKDNTLYNGTNSYTQNPKYTVNQCGLVIANPIANSEWKTWQFAFGYNRIMDFNNVFRAQGPNHSSFIDPILASANGTSYQNLTYDADIAWDSWLIDTVRGYNSLYFSPFHDKDLEQTAVVKQSGAIDEMTITFGGNYNDKLYIGGGIGIPILDYTEHTSFSEIAADGAPIQGITDYSVITHQNDRGAGINAKIGIIYQPVNFLRLNFAIQTPTYYWKIRDSYSREMISYWVGANNQQGSYDSKYNFSLTTPFRFNAGLSFIINKRAFIDAEYEMSDYGMATLLANDYSFTFENEDIRNRYGACHTFRVGGEVNLSSHFALRAGYNYKSSPYLKSSGTSNTTFNASAHYGSIGFGFRSKVFFADLAYVLRYCNDAYTLYDCSFSGSYSNTTAEIKSTTHRVVATIGCKF